MCECIKFSYLLKTSLDLQVEALPTEILNNTALENKAVSCPPQGPLRPSQGPPRTTSAQGVVSPPRSIAPVLPASNEATHANTVNSPPRARANPQTSTASLHLSPARKTSAAEEKPEAEEQEFPAPPPELVQCSSPPQVRGFAVFVVLADSALAIRE